VVWVRRWATDARSEIDGGGLLDPRVVHFWDRGQVIGQPFLDRFGVDFGAFSGMTYSRHGGADAASSTYGYTTLASDDQLITALVVTEVAEVCQPVAEAGLPYVTHMRGYGAAAATGFAEARAIGAAAGVAVHISHYHGPGAALLSMVDDARSSGLDITFDSYPYLRSCTILAMAALPRWLDDTDLDRTVDALSDPTNRRRVIDGLNPDLLTRITLAHVPDPDDGQQWSWSEGCRLIDAAAEAGVPAGELLVDLLVHTRLAASAVIEAPPSTDEESMRALLRHPAHMAGSDGIYVGGHPHPRGWGAFARLLGRHVRELGDWTWEQAAAHLASHPARRFGLVDRGIIRPGLAADLAVIDPVKVADRADYASPRVLAVGVDDVIVNGVPVLRDGRLTGRLAGAPLTPHSGG